MQVMLIFLCICIKHSQPTLHSPPPCIHKGKKFFKNGCHGGDRKFLLKWGQARNGGVGFIMGGWEIFKVSLHSWQRGANPTILWTPPPPYIASPHSSFSNFVNPTPTSHPTSLLPPTHTPTVPSVVSLAEWAITTHLMCYYFT